MARMAPPGGGGKGPDMVIAIGAHPVPGKGQRMQPPGDAGAAGGDGKVAPEQADVLRADQHCIDCKNYNDQTAECAKVQGNFDPQDGCLHYFEPLEGGDEEQEGDQQPDSPEEEMAEQSQGR